LTRILVLEEQDSLKVGESFIINKAQVMNYLIKQYLMNKSSRSNKMLAMIIMAVAAGQPWC